jgi:hypothetical protein
MNLTEREKCRAHLGELAWTVFGAAVLLALVWKVLHLGGV